MLNLGIDFVKADTAEIRLTVSNAIKLTKRSKKSKNALTSGEKYAAKA